MNTSSFRRFSNEEALEWGRKHYSDWLINMQNQDNKPATPLEEFFRYYTQGAHVSFNSTTRLDKRDFLKHFRPPRLIAANVSGQQ